MKIAVKYLILTSLVTMVFAFFVQANKVRPGAPGNTTPGLTKANDDVGVSRDIVEKSLKSIIDNQSLKNVLSEDELHELTESLKKTDHNYLERKILSNNKEVKKFRGLYYKVLKNANDKQEYDDVLQNTRMISNALDILNTKNKSFTYSDQVERMIFVDFVNESIGASSQRGIGAAGIHQMVDEIILSSIIFDETLPVQLRKSLYMDRIEIFNRYASVYPDYATALVHQVKTSKYRDYLLDIIDKVQA